MPLPIPPSPPRQYANFWPEHTSLFVRAGTRAATKSQLLPWKMEAVLPDLREQLSSHTPPEYCPWCCSKRFHGEKRAQDNRHALSRADPTQYEYNVLSPSQALCLFSVDTFFAVVSLCLFLSLCLSTCLPVCPSVPTYLSLVPSPFIPALQTHTCSCSRVGISLIAANRESSGSPRLRLFDS